MSIHPIKNKAGEVTSVRAIAGKVMGSQIKTTFSIKRFGSIGKAEAAAQRWIDQKRREMEVDRHSVIAIPDRRRSEIIEAYELLEPYGVRLVDAVREWVQSKESKRDVTPWTFSEATAFFLQSRRDKKCRVEYLRSLEDTFNLFGMTFGDRVLDDITPEELDGWLRGRGRSAPIAPVTWRNYRRDIGMVFRFAVERNRATQNPIKYVSEPQDEQKPVKILFGEQVKKLACSADASVIGIVTVMAFSGIRPFEVLQLPPESINLERRFIEIAGRHAKSRTRRLVTISDNLVSWLGAHPLRVQFGSYWPLRRLLREAARRAELDLTPDILRHSFGSHHLALHRNAALTAHEMGNSERMVYRHYREVVSEQDARDYFNVVP